MNRSFLLASLVLVAPPFAGCQPAESADAPDVAPAVTTETAVNIAADRAAIEAMTVRYQAAARAGDAAAIQALHADDAVLHPPTEPAARGRADVDAYLAASHAEPSQATTFTSADVVVSDDGRLAYEVGTAVWPDGPGKYLTVYRKTADGWRIVADSWSEDALPTTAD